MKRMIVVALLAGVLISTIGVTMAAGERNPVLTRVIFGSDERGCWIGPAVGIITFDTETGEWTITTHAPLPRTDVDLYHLAITVSAPHGRYITPDTEYGCAASLATVYSVDGRIEASGTLSDIFQDPQDLQDYIDIIIQLLEDRAVFVLTTNSI